MPTREMTRREMTKQVVAKSGVKAVKAVKAVNESIITRDQRPS
ncbi:MAG: hypothetical protein WCY01_09325 [Alkalispirochaeta sp.]|jgi:hypothetical protein